MPFRLRRTHHCRSMEMLQCVSSTGAASRPMSIHQIPGKFNDRSLRAGSFRRRLFAEVTRLDIVPIEIEHEGGVVIVAVLAPKPWRPICAARPIK